MADEPRTGVPAGEPPDEAAVRRLVDALRGPGTAEELSREDAYVTAFAALHAPADEPAPASVGGRHAQRTALGRRLRLGALGGIAALAVTGTAAAITGSLPVPVPGARHEPAPSATSAPVPTASGSAGTRTTRPLAPGGTTSGSAGTPSATSPGTPPSPSVSVPPTSTPPTTTAPPSGTAAPSPTPTPRPTPSPKPSRTPRPTPSPTASPSPSATPSAQVKSLCRQYQRGKVKKGSPRWDQLVALAGSAAAIPAFCREVLGP